jgi:hypothetical protein
MHSHIFAPSVKKDIYYCKICCKLSYKDNYCQELPFNSSYKYDIDPLTFKFKPVSIVANYKCENHIKYLESKKIGITKIKNLVHNFGLKSMIFYKAINFMNQIFLENQIAIENIENIASLCVLLITVFHECCLPSISEELMTKNENNIFYQSHIKNVSFCNDVNKRNNELVREESIRHKTNIRGLFHYIIKNVNNYKYWEVFCLKKINYDLGKYSSYDYLILFFELGICFCKEKINNLEILKYSVNILYLVTNDIRACEYSQYTLAMSIIKIAFENNVFFDKNVFKYIYGVDLSKKKYLNCSNMIITILNVSNNKINNLINFENNNDPIYQILYILNKNKNKGSNNNESNNLINIISYIINNNIIINNNFIHNNININNYNNNIYYQNFFINNYIDSIGNLGFNNANSNYFINLNNFQKSKNKNFNYNKSN